MIVVIHMLGNILFVGLNTTDKNVIRKLILDCHIGGITLYKKLYQNYNEMLDIINYIKKLSQEANYNILIGIDQEGGRVNRLPDDFKNIRSAYSLKGDPKNFKETAHIYGTILNSSGINVNFAPVLDIKRFEDNHAIGNRAFGNDYLTITSNATSYISELKKHNVIPVVKHFPGHGATLLNTHHFIPIILNTNKLFKEDIIPFKEAINNDIDFIMVGHFFIKKYSLLTPSSISKKIVSLLRNDLHYQNLIITDDLTMGPLKLINKPYLIKKAINNGVNIIMIKYYDNFFNDYQKLIKLYNQNKLNQENISNSLAILNSIKEKYQINNQEIKNTLDISKINKEIENLNAKASY